MPKEELRVGAPRRALASALSEAGLSLSELERAAGERLGEPLALQVATLPPGATPCVAIAETAFTLQLGSRTVRLSLDPDLVALVVALHLREKEPLSAPHTPLGDALRGAFAAWLVDVARHVCHEQAVSWLRVARCSVATSCTFDGMATFRQRNYPWRAEFDAADPLSASNGGNPHALPVTLSLIAAVNDCAPEEVAALSVGDVWLPGEGWWIVLQSDGKPAGPCALGAADAENGVRVHLEDHAIAFDESAVPLVPLMPLMPDVAASDRIVVHVELGQLALEARQWVVVRAGDRLPLPNGFGRELTLRAAGCALAVGELVQVDGELGVRVTAL